MIFEIGLGSHTSFNSNLASFVCRSASLKHHLLACLIASFLSSHAMALGPHELATVARSCKVRVLVRLGSLFATSHLSLVKRVASGDGVFVSRHCNAHLAFFKEWTSHRLLSLLPARWRIDHLLRFKQKLINSVLALDWRTSAHPVHIVSIHGHLLRVDELVNHRFAISRL